MDRRDWRGARLFGCSVYAVTHAAYSAQRMVSSTTRAEPDQPRRNAYESEEWPKQR